MKIIDTHAHYDDPRFDEDRHDILSSMLRDSVQAVINIGCDIESSRFSVSLAGQYENVFAAVGIHPGNTDDVGDDYLEIISGLCKDKNTVAIGEIGLDYHYEGFDRERQIKFFKEQLSLAKQLSKPVIIHSRDACEDTMKILREMRPEKAVMHCFSGSPEIAAELVKMGIMISFTGVLTFKNSRKAAEVCKNTPIEMLMLETDCPYMAPIPHRGSRCDSRMTHYTAERLAQIKGIDTEQAIGICNANAIKFFGLPVKP